MDTFTLTVTAIDESRLQKMWANAADERGNRLVAFAAEGWEPLRCCLTMPTPGEQIVLIAYNPFDTSSAWAETGPVYIHAQPCAGYADPGELPARLRTGPKILRTYRDDGTLDYDHIVEVAAGVDIEESLRQVLAIPRVHTVHVRAVVSQCFGYAVSRSEVGAQQDS